MDFTVLLSWPARVLMSLPLVQGAHPAPPAPREFFEVATGRIPARTSVSKELFWWQRGGYGRRPAVFLLTRRLGEERVLPPLPRGADSLRQVLIRSASEIYVLGGSLETTEPPEPCSNPTADAMDILHGDPDLGCMRHQPYLLRFDGARWHDLPVAGHEPLCAAELGTAAGTLWVLRCTEDQQDPPAAALWQVTLNRPQGPARWTRTAQVRGIAPRWDAAHGWDDARLKDPQLIAQDDALWLSFGRQVLIHRWSSP